MKDKRKTIITLLILGGLALLLIFFVIGPIVKQIKKESENLIFQKKELLELGDKIKNLQDFRTNLNQRQSNLEKINDVFVDAAEPIEFIEFLEKEAANSRLAIEIIPSVNLEFSLNLEGSFSDFSRFLERLEYGPYLITPLDLSVRKISEKKDTILAVLLIKTYAK